MQLKKTIATVSKLLESELFDPITRNKAEEVKRALEKSLRPSEVTDSAGRPSVQGDTAGKHYQSILH
jgi:hypothetical protein